MAPHNALGLYIDGIDLKIVHVVEAWEENGISWICTMLSSQRDWKWRPL